MKYVNFFPGTFRGGRDIVVTSDASYALAEDAGNFMEHMAIGCSSSIALDEIQPILSDDEELDIIKEVYAINDMDLQQLVDELHGVIA